jgi:hypothetical protein
VGLGGLGAWCDCLGLFFLPFGPVLREKKLRFWGKSRCASPMRTKMATDGHLYIVGRGNRSAHRKIKKCARNPRSPNQQMSRDENPQYDKYGDALYEMNATGHSGQACAMAASILDYMTPKSLILAQNNAPTWDFGLMCSSFDAEIAHVFPKHTSACPP